mgnify:CR=1 FL=1
MEAYTSFAYVYDTFMDNVPYGEWARHIREKLCEHGVTDGIVLDLGCGPGLYAELLQRFAPLDPQTTLSSISIGTDQFKATVLRVLADRVRLVFRRVFLMVRGHADIFGRTALWRGVRRFFS